MIKHVYIYIQVEVLPTCCQTAFLFTRARAFCQQAISKAIKATSCFSACSPSTKRPPTQVEFKGEEVGAAKTAEQHLFHVCSPFLENTYIQVEVLPTCCQTAFLFTRARAFCQQAISKAIKATSCFSACSPSTKRPPTQVEFSHPSTRP